MKDWYFIFGVVGSESMIRLAPNSGNNIKMGWENAIANKIFNLIFLLFGYKLDVVMNIEPAE